VIVEDDADLSSMFWPDTAARRLYDPRAADGCDALRQLKSNAIDIVITIS